MFVLCNETFCFPFKIKDIFPYKNTAGEACISQLMCVRNFRQRRKPFCLASFPGLPRYCVRFMPRDRCACGTVKAGKLFAYFIN